MLGLPLPGSYSTTQCYQVLQLPPPWLLLMTMGTTVVLAAAAAASVGDRVLSHCHEREKGTFWKKNERKREVKFSLFGFRGSVGRRGRKKEKSYPVSFFSSSLSGLEKYLMSLKYGLQNISDIYFVLGV